MSTLLQKLKEKAFLSASTKSEAQIVQIPADAKSFVCKNHFTVSPKGKQVVVRVVLSFLPNEKQRTCECGIIYKKV